MLVFLRGSACLGLGLGFGELAVLVGYLRVFGVVCGVGLLEFDVARGLAWYAGWVGCVLDWLEVAVACVIGLLVVLLDVFIVVAWYVALVFMCLLVWWVLGFGCLGFAVCWYGMSSGLFGVDFGSRVVW